MRPAIAVVNSLPSVTLEVLETIFPLYHLWQANDSTTYLAEVQDKITGLAAFGATPITSDLMDALARLSIIATMGAGVDHIDLEAARVRSIRVTHAPDVLTEDVADIGIGLLLCSARHLVAGDRFVRNGRWLTGAMPLAKRIAGSSLGILGLGRIGRAVARRAKALGMRIAYHSLRRKSDVRYRYYDLTAMARDVDFLMITCPGSAPTRQLVNAQVLKALGSKGVVINIARGSVIDESALVRALQQGTIGGAALDVFADEPRVSEALFTLDNVVLQPHVGSATHETRAAMDQLMIDNLRAHFAGKPLLTPIA
jgi:lactate dehydrogenase-like 2-hydroxyacid dehydrogenase